MCFAVSMLVLCCCAGDGRNTQRLMKVTKVCCMLFSGFEASCGAVLASVVVCTAHAQSTRCTPLLALPPRCTAGDLGFFPISPTWRSQRMQFQMPK